MGVMRINGHDFNCPAARDHNKICSCGKIQENQKFEIDLSRGGRVTYDEYGIGEYRAPGHDYVPQDFKFHDFKMRDLFPEEPVDQNKCDHKEWVQKFGGDTICVDCGVKWVEFKNKEEEHKAKKNPDLVMEAILEAMVMKPEMRVGELITQAVISAEGFATNLHDMSDEKLAKAIREYAEVSENDSV